MNVLKASAGTCRGLQDLFSALWEEVQGDEGELGLEDRPYMCVNNIDVVE